MLGVWWLFFRAHLDTTTIRAAEATERPTPDRAAARTKHLVPPNQESGAPVVEAAQWPFIPRLICLRLRLWFTTSRIAQPTKTEFAMWPFSKKWSAPEPHLAMIVSLANQDLPPLIELANPAGANGAVAGMAGPADQKPSPENMLMSMKEGPFVAISPAGGLCTVDVKRVSPESVAPLSIAPEMLEVSGLTEEMLAKFNQPAWRVVIQMATPAEDVKETVVFAARLAQRMAALGDGIVMDTAAFRYFGPAGWAVDDPIGEFDAREHVHLHIGEESRWFHTHGLIKFGRPEMEIYDVPPEMDQAAWAMMFDLSQYIITTALVEPGQTCGDPNQPFYAREGTKNQKDHWEGISVLELVDLDDEENPVASGAPKALQTSAAQ